jgi:3D (Asp-Asp-Asp) domain-containing protein
VRLVYHNGKVADTEVLAEELLQAPVTEVVEYGTRVVWKPIDTEQGTKQYWRKLRAYATSYSLSRSGTSPDVPWYGRTRMGLKMGKGIIAVDPKVIPLGMWLYVPGYGVGIAGDTGGGIKGYHIDLGFDDENYESWHRSVDVYILDRLPPEHQMRWILPAGGRR